MEDLKAIFNAGVVLALCGIGGWLVVLCLVSLIRLLVKGMIGFGKLNAAFTRENPYIAAHKKMLIEQEQYAEYVAVARKDGFLENNDEDTVEA